MLQQLLWSIEDERDVWGSVDEYERYDGSGLLYYAFKTNIEPVIKALQPKKVKMMGLLMKQLEKKMIGGGFTLLHKAAEEGNLIIL